MYDDELVTGEAVALELRLAALPSRVLAGAIDTAAQLLLLLVLALLAVAGDTALSDAGRSAVGVVVVLAVLAGYPIAFESLWRGRTPGKAALGLRVVRDDGGPVGFRQSLVRGLASTFLERPGITLFTGAVLSMLIDTRSKRLGDLLAGTVVLQERIAGGTGPAAVLPPALVDWATGLDLAGLPDGLALSARSYLARYGELTAAAQQELGARLAGAVASVVAPPPPAGTPAWAYLSAVLAERRRRSGQATAPVGPPEPPPGPTPGPTPGAPPEPPAAASPETGHGPSPGPAGFAAPG